MSYVRHFWKRHMEYSETIILGVASGVITSLFLYLLSIIFTRIILPWYQRLTYGGIDVSGEWIGKLKGNKAVYWKATLNLKQSAHSLSGIYSIVKISQGNAGKTTHMKVSGEVWEGFVSLKYRTVSNRNLSFGSILLKINDSELKGVQASRNLAQTGSEIANLSLLLEREKEYA